MRARIGQMGSEVHTPGFTRKDHIQYLGGQLGKLVLDDIFPTHTKSEGVDIGPVVRLTKFHELNTIRVIFRFLFTLPFVILGVAGAPPHKHVNESMLWTGITLTIFFPRSVEGEMASKQARKTRSQTHSQSWSDTSSMAENRPSLSQSGRHLSYEYSTKPYALSTHNEHPLEQGYENDLGSPISPNSINKTFYSPMEGDMYHTETLPKLAPIRPNRRIGGDVELGGIGARTAVNIQVSHRTLMYNSGNTYSVLQVNVIVPTSPWTKITF
ncbi:hypothetical protein MPER_05647 [Moniliophthora perniciosa FA553]|nr:hypothetical protein MPER_05647 [Moniliophthora perniciosa FA553]